VCLGAIDVVPRWEDMGRKRAVARQVSVEPARAEIYSGLHTSNIKRDALGDQSCTSLGHCTGAGYNSSGSTKTAPAMVDTP
jgi:hypothetical protein